MYKIIKLSQEIYQTFPVIGTLQSTWLEVVNGI